jgi:hypothetical protein
MAADDDLDGAIRAYADAHRLGEATLARWLGWATADRAALLDLARALGPGGNHLTDLMEWLEDIAARDARPAAAVLAGAELRGVLATSLGRGDKLKRVKALVRAARLPRLAALERALAETVHGLELGAAVSVHFPPGLEGDELRVEVRARDPDALRDAVRRLAAVVEAGGFERLFARLDEAS